MGPTNDAFRITRLSKVIAAILVVLFAVQYFVPSVISYLALVPGRTLPCIWNLVTAGFLTTNVFKLVFEVLAVLFLTRLVEPVYGSKEFLKFIFIVDLSICTAVLVGVYIYFAAAGKDDKKGDVLYMKFYGFHGILAGLVVAVKQVMPDHEAKLFGFIKLTFKYLPLLFIAGSVGVCFALNAVAQLPFVVLGAYSAWVYLRFFQQQSDQLHYGDASDDFKFSGFFPSFLAPVIDPFGLACATVFRLRHPPAETKAPFAAVSPYSLGSDAADANRRRERGAKALEERLGGGAKKQSDVDLEAAAGAEGGSAPVGASGSS